MSEGISVTIEIDHRDDQEAGVGFYYSVNKGGLVGPFETEALAGQAAFLAVTAAVADTASAALFGE